MARSYELSSLSNTSSLKPRTSSSSSSTAVDSLTTGKPLIDLVTNQWKHPSDLYDNDDSDDEDFFNRDGDDWVPPRWLVAVDPRRRSRRVQRMYLLGTIILVGLLVGWNWWLRPRWKVQRDIESSVKKPVDNFIFQGANARSDFEGTTMVADMDPSLLPSWDDASRRNRRLIFIGDVHGCKEELDQLLKKVDFSKQTDHLILTGDMINKGPDSPGVIDLAISLNASSVRGNHEDKMLLAYRDIHAEHKRPAKPDRPPAHSNPQDPGAAYNETLDHRSQRGEALARQFSEKQIAWIQSLPIILRVGAIPGAPNLGTLLCVHAGLAPGVPLDRQDPFQVMNMRAIDLKTRFPTSERDWGVPWERVWNEWMMKHVKKEDRMTVVYGHDSKRGLNVQTPWSKGLDSACVTGGKLSAMVVGVEDDGERKGVGKGYMRVVQVGCKGYKVRKRDRKSETAGG